VIDGLSFDRYARHVRWIAGLVVVLLLAAPVSARRPLKKPRHGFQVRLTGVELQPGDDVEFCEYQRLPNRKAIDVSALEWTRPGPAPSAATTARTTAVSSGNSG
jgi:hypothetical protein